MVGVLPGLRFISVFVSAVKPWGRLRQGDLLTTEDIPEADQHLTPQWLTVGPPSTQ